MKVRKKMLIFYLFASLLKSGV